MSIDGIENDIASAREQVGLALDEQSFEAALEQMADAFVTAVEFGICLPQEWMGNG